MKETWPADQMEASENIIEAPNPLVQGRRTVCSDGKFFDFRYCRIPFGGCTPNAKA
jgi:hypothetical protein